MDYENFTTHEDPVDPSSINDDDTSYIPFINEIWIVAPASEIIIKTSLFLPIVVFGIFGNTLIIHTLYRNKHIQTPTNMLIGNMAVADLCSVVIHPWVFLTYSLFQNYELGILGCKGEAALECTLLIASVISLSAISYDRLTAIVLPKETRLNQRGTKILIVIAWMAAALLSIPFILERKYRTRQWANFEEKYCTEETTIVNVYWYVIVTVIVWLPLTIQLICYIAIFVELNKYERVVLRKLNLHQVSYKKKAVRMMFVVVLTFMVCRLPFTGLIIYRHKLLQENGIGTSHAVQNQVNGYYYILWFLSKYLIYVNAALNPLIYGVTNEKFRRAFKTTKLANWLFSPHRFIPIVVKSKDKDVRKTDDTTLKLQHNIFLIFKRQPKHHPVETTENTSSVFASLNRCKYYDN